MLNKLVRGNRYTLVGNDGYLNFKLDITLIDFMYKQYAQYEDVPYITYKKKGGRKIYKMYLSYQYSFFEGWQEIKMKEFIEEDRVFITYRHLKYNEIDLSKAILSGKVGEVKIYRQYESLIDHSFNLAVKYGLHSEEYKLHFKEIFTELNYSLNNEMKNYYKQHHDYFLKVLDEVFETL